MSTCLFIQLTTFQLLYKNFQTSDHLAPQIHLWIVGCWSVFSLFSLYILLLICSLLRLPPLGNSISYFLSESTIQFPQIFKLINWTALVFLCWKEAEARKLFCMCTFGFSLLYLYIWLIHVLFYYMAYTKEKLYKGRGLLTLCTWEESAGHGQFENRFFQ